MIFSRYAWLTVGLSVTAPVTAHPYGYLREGGGEVQPINVRLDMCHDGKTIGVLASEVPGHLRAGDTLGPCDDPTTEIGEVMEGLAEAAAMLDVGELNLAGGSTLSGGEQKMLEIGRAMLLDPKVLLMLRRDRSDLLGSSRDSAE